MKEAPMDDVNRIASLTDGVYSMLENLNAKYRVLACGAADQTISSKIPRPAEFKVASGNSKAVLNDLITVTAKVDAADIRTAKKYEFKFEQIAAPETDNFEDIYTAKVMRIVPSVASVAALADVNVPAGEFVMVMTGGVGSLKRILADGYESINAAGLVGSLYLVDGKIYKGALSGTDLVFNAEAVVVVGEDATYQGKQYVLAESNNEVFCMKVVDGAKNVQPLGDIKTMMSDNEDKTLVFAQNNWFETNPVVVRSANYTGFTLSEFVEYLNQNEVLRKLFSFAIADAAVDKQNDFVSEIMGSLPDTDLMAEDRTIAYDYTKYIPFRTTDNFARQMAQHCTYTELKTCPAHGVVGCERIADTGLTSVANKVDSVLAIEMDLYAKNKVGRNMLDKNNMPYPIGKNISVVLGQHFVTLDDGYSWISNGAAAYAGMVSVLPLDQSSTAQPISINSTMFELTNFQLGRLTQKGIVTFRQSYTRGIVVTDGVTQAPVSSVFRRLACTRVFHSVEQLIREACEPYIGKQNNTTNRNSLQTAIKSKLDSIKGKLIEAYEFNLVVDQRIAKFNILNIDYRVVPIYEIREIRNRITVKDKL